MGAVRWPFAEKLVQMYPIPILDVHDNGTDLPHPSAVSKFARGVMITPLTLAWLTQWEKNNCYRLALLAEGTALETSLLPTLQIHSCERKDKDKILSGTMNV